MLRRGLPAFLVGVIWELQIGVMEKSNRHVGCDFTLLLDGGPVDGSLTSSPLSRHGRKCGSNV